MNKWLTSVAVLLGIGVAASEAQFYQQRPITNPTVRPGTGPVFNPYYGNPLNPYPLLGGNYYGPLLGNQAGVQPGLTATGVGPGGVLTNPAGMGANAAVGSTGIVTPLMENITGHPTAFNVYSMYFNNQGGALTANVLATAGQPNATPGVLTRRGAAVGVRPPQGRGNAAQP